jgi:SAM-dependent methyltransferase
MISKWIIKAIIQKTISYFPGSQKINTFFQKYITRGVHLTDEHFGLKLQHARDHLQYLLKYDSTQSLRTILELGTGWYPVIPILFFLTSSGQVISVDIQGWMTLKTQLATILKMKEWRDKGKLDDLLPVINEERWEQLMSVLRDTSAFDCHRINQLIGLKPLIQDARDLDIETGTVDFICSNNTLEHIPDQILRDILLEFKRVLKPGGVMSHFIDMSDHFAHFDSRITIYNFLRFSKKRWRFIDNSIQPQNRLRYKDYTEMFRLSGFSVSEEAIQRGNPEDVELTGIHPEFSSYTTDELAISHAYIISVPDAPFS